ncbi:hypothetical protein [Rhizobium sp. SSA_523]|uniref:hypothetical protein n=1 Tax=Rhizobium sp. SSA_523 TaxID=2952477 RepID=UPI00209021DB|nr:hypothetical protein [Rhizobium sp. SSA_523]MCO5733778.1 hypothetical protein [Rhizobium sp. SSA_523]WKC24947.1 hypothetical protein QTJ18_13145 [Rhizobium sp. SSA_523]
MSDKRRNCADRARAEAMTRKIHRRKRFDPAMSVFIKMLGLASFVINLLPEFGSTTSISLPEPPRPEPVREPLPETEPRTYRLAPSWPRLMKDLARPVARSMAAGELYARLPVEVRPWLDEVVKTEDWSSLRFFAKSGATDEMASAGALAAFRRWKADKETEVQEVLDATAKGGKAGAVAKPRGTGK